MTSDGNDPMDAPATVPKGEKPDFDGSDGNTTTPKQLHGAAILVRCVQWLLVGVAALSWWALFSATRLVDITAFGMYALSTAALVVALEAVTWRWSDD
jgi:hypothetical protein